MFMKKILILSLMFIFICALSAQSWASLDEGEKMDYAESQMALDLTESGSFNRVLLGFTDHEVKSFSDVVTRDLSEYVLQTNEDGIAHSLGYLYVFYQIQSAEALDISLYARSPFTLSDISASALVYYDLYAYEDNDESKEKIVFINGIDDEGRREENPTGYESSRDGVYVYHHRPSVSIGSVGSLELHITSEDFRTKPIGIYTSTLVLRVDSV